MFVERFPKLASTNAPSSLPGVSERLIVFTRYPEPGKTKTRLIPALGPQGAAQLQLSMTQYTLNWARQLRYERGLALEVRFAGGTAAQMKARFGEEFDYGAQEKGDLGARMLRALDEAMDQGCQRVVLVGSDCPGLDAPLAAAAFKALADHDLVLGPATDGGYYLIGLRRSIPQLFAGMNWGAEEVLLQTARSAAALGLAIALLKPLVDVDRPEDLPIWKAAVKRSHPLQESTVLDFSGNRLHRQKLTPRSPHPQAPNSDPLISVIIPTLNEAENILLTLASACSGEGTEVIVVDGGSIDETVSLARACGAKVLSSPPGRARQMNAGAEAARGKILLFLHADTRLPQGFLAEVPRTLRQPGTVAGTFELKLDAERKGFRWIERMANLRARRWQLPYGDQAIFLAAQTFRKIGAYAEIPLMEDVELVRRLRRQGRIALAHAPASTSARRWQKRGLWRTTLINQLCFWAYCLGVPPARIARWYGEGHWLNPKGDRT